MSTASSTSEALLHWYDLNRRALPWRELKDPYPIWLSEVILQQTRVDQGMAYWHRFMERFPTVETLAAAREEEVLKLWQGLGYYSRARNLLVAARQVVYEHGGHFPDDLDGLRNLRGVGPYTAAAIGSIAFGLHAAVVDGNVYRVLSRLYDIATPMDSTAGAREFAALARTLLHPQRPGDHNQAMMELGATLCTPRDPRCDSCPVALECLARARGTIAGRPVKAGRTKVRTRHFNYLHVQEEGHLYLRKRTGRDIWQGLFELPLVESQRSCGPKALERLLLGTMGTAFALEARSPVITHILSHQRIQAVFWRVRPGTGWSAPEDWLRTPLAKLKEHAVPRLIERWMEGEAPYRRL